MSGLLRFFHGNHLAAKVLRFGVVGGLAALTYAVVTAGLVTGFGVLPVPAAFAGYCASVPFAFVGHRSFSFRSKGRLSIEAVRFLLAQVLNVSVTLLSMHAVTEWFDAPWWWGVVAATILVPAANFVFMNLWVFRDQQHDVEVAT